MAFLRHIAAGGVVALLLAAAPAAAEPVELQGTMTVSTSGAGSVLVRVAHDTPTFPNADGTGAIQFHFTGKAVLKTVVLLAESPGAGGKRWAGFVDGSLLEGGSGNWSSQTMPGGVYRLYAMTDGRPATITITMPGGSGNAALPLPDPAAVDVHLIQPGAMGVFRAAASTTGPGVVFGAIGGSFMSGQAGTVEFCDAVGGAADTDAAYRPGCSNGGSFFGAGGTDFRYIEAETLVEATGAQRHGFGVNVQSVGTPEIDGAVGALTFTTAGTPGASASPAPVLGTTARVVGARVKVKSGKARVPVHCSGPGSCHVRVAIANSRAKGKALIRAGATRMVTVKLTNALRKRLKRSRSVKATLVLEVSGAAGQATQVTRTRVKLSGS